MLVRNTKFLCITSRMTVSVYPVKSEYTLTVTFPYVGISINGLMVEFADVPIDR